MSDVGLTHIEVWSNSAFFRTHWRLSYLPNYLTGAHSSSITHPRYVAVPSVLP